MASINSLTIQTTGGLTTEHGASARTPTLNGHTSPDLLPASKKRFRFLLLMGSARNWTTRLTLEWIGLTTLKGKFSAVEVKRRDLVVPTSLWCLA